MNRLLVASFFALILILSACSSNNEESTAEAENEVTSTEEETDGELSEIEKENEELREELAKKENEELKSELEDEESEESNEDNNDEEEQTQDEVNNDSEENNSNEVLALTVDECVLALFENDCQENFPKKEVQDTYLEYAYNDEVPYEGGGSQSLEYVVESVQYYDENGEFPELDEIEVENEVETEDYEEYRVAITDYLDNLTRYYNVGSTSGDAIFQYLKEGNPAYDKIMDNKDSGYFADHVTHDIFVGHMYPQDDGTITIEVTRTYEHANSNGVEDAVVTYIMDMETHEIIDFN